MSGESGVRPVDIEVQRDSGQLRIKWADGHESIYRLLDIRLACPCATCRTEREDQRGKPLRVISNLSSPENMSTVRDVSLAGRYALRITWNDGHNTGIYDFELLRALCPCANCRAEDR
jgi:DUF971 family protein